MSTAAGAALQSDKRDAEAAAGNPADTYVIAVQGWAVSHTFTSSQGIELVLQPAKGLGCCAKANTGCSKCLELAVEAAFTHASSLDDKEETQANPLKIEDFLRDALRVCDAFRAAA